MNPTSSRRNPVLTRITSRRNAVVERYRAAARGDEPGLMLLDGPHLLAEALVAGIRLQHVMVAGQATDRPEVREIIARLGAKGIDVATGSAPVLVAVSPVRSPSGIVAIAERPAYDHDRPFACAAPLVLVACDVQDPGNMGAMIRVGEAGGASGIIAAGKCANPFGWKALRGSMGSALRLPIATRTSADLAVVDARRRGCRIVAAVPRGGHSMFDADLTGPLAILVGGEGPGLAPALVGGADQSVTIPMQPPVESLNTAVTAALLVYEARRQRISKSGQQMQSRRHEDTKDQKGGCL